MAAMEAAETTRAAMMMMMKPAEMAETIQGEKKKKMNYLAAVR